MNKSFSLLAGVAFTALLAAGCAGPEHKFGRGMRNTFEVVRTGELRRSMEQTALVHNPEAAYTTGFITGVNRTLARTGIGIYELVTFPLPPYGPVATDYLAPDPVYPDNYRPTLLSDSLFATDTNLGFSGGDVLPWLPGCRFRLFDTH
jgi:putative exosortase-associated protein (TIGR04073 family)